MVQGIRDSLTFASDCNSALINGERPFIAPLAVAALLLFALATLLRWWVIRTLGIHWNTEVVDSASLGVISAGPFRWIRHPNYLGVFVELIALPLIHTAWITAAIAQTTATRVRRLRTKKRPTT